jgi:hypothetical protein
MIKQVLVSIGFPLLLAAALIAVCWMIRQLRSQAWLRDGVFGVALCGAFFVAFCLETAFPSVPPASKWHMLAIIAAGCVILGWPVAALVRGQWPAAELLGLCSGGLIAWLIELPEMDTVHRGLLGLSIAASVVTLDRIAQRLPGAIMFLSLWLVFAGLSILSEAAAFLSLAIICGAMSAVSCSAAVIGGCAGHPGMGRGGAWAVGVMLPLIAFCGWSYNYGPVSWWHWLLVAGSPLLLLVMVLIPMGRMRSGWVLLIRLLVVLFPIAVGAGSVIQAAAAETDPMMEMYGVELQESDVHVAGRSVSHSPGL